MVSSDKISVGSERDCKGLTTDVTRWDPLTRQHAMKDLSTGTEECYFAQPPRICLKKFEDCLVGCGKEKLYGYVPTENRWYEMANYLSPKLFPFHMAACDGKLYVTGGTFNPHQSTIEEYNPSRNSWTRLNSYTSAIACILSAVINFQGSLFVIGGKKEQQRNKEKGSNSVYKYSPDTETWKHGKFLMKWSTGVSLNRRILQASPKMKWKLAILLTLPINSVITSPI